MLKKVRSFFYDKNVLEVDTPVLSKAAPIDSNIDILETMATECEKGYFHSSPEYGMKKLLAKGAPDIYQLSHVYRKSEQSKKHKVEFTMIEWYRMGFSLEKLIEETKELIQLFIGDIDCHYTTYNSIFKECFGVDLEKECLESLKKTAKKHGLFGENHPKQIYLDFLFDIAEKSFSEDSIVFVTDFPKEQAFLAKTYKKNGVEYASRFEAFYKGYELANGFDELQDAKILRERFEQALETRTKRNKPPLPIDEEFLACLSAIPDCSGVAVGFDRLMMLRMGASDIHEVTYSN